MLHALDEPSAPPQDVWPRPILGSSYMQRCVGGGGYTPAGEGADDESFTIFFFPLSTPDSPPRFAGTCACENRRELSQNTAPSRSLAFHLPLPSPLSPSSCASA